MQRAEQERLRADQRIVVAELAEALTARAPDGLDPQFRALFDAAADDRAASGDRRPDRVPHRRVGPLAAHAADGEPGRVPADDGVT